MDYPQIVTAAIAIVAVIISLVSLSRYGAVQRQQLRLQRKQEQLTTLQLDMLQKQAAAAASPPAEKADVRDARNFVLPIVLLPPCRTPDQSPS